MTWNQCCEECLNDGTCLYQDNDMVEDCNKYFDYSDPVYIDIDEDYDEYGENINEI